MGFLRKWRKTAIIRYFWNNKKDLAQNIKTTMLLFHPFRNNKHNSTRIALYYKSTKHLKVLLTIKKQLFKPNQNFMNEFNNILIEHMELDEDK